MKPLITWILLGAFCGLLQYKEVGDTWIALVSSTIAGSIVYVPLGIVAALIKTKSQDIALGAGIGLLTGLVLTLSLPANGLNLTVGALVLMTVKPILSLIKYLTYLCY